MNFKKCCFTLFFFSKSFTYLQGLIKQEKEVTPEFVGIDLESPDDVVIDIADAEKLAQIVCSNSMNNVQSLLKHVDLYIFPKHFKAIRYYRSNIW